MSNKQRGTMTDELKQEMTEKFNSAYGEEVKIGLREALCKVYIDGCEHGYQYAVEKVCEFLKKYAANFVALPDEGQQPIGDTNAIYGTKSLLYYLRKAMED